MFTNYQATTRKLNGKRQKLCHCRIRCKIPTWVAPSTWSIHRKLPGAREYNEALTPAFAAFIDGIPRSSIEAFETTSNKKRSNRMPKKRRLDTSTHETPQTAEPSQAQGQSSGVKDPEQPSESIKSIDVLANSASILDYYNTIVPIDHGIDATSEA